MIQAMLIVIGAWLLLFCLIAGIGQLARRLFHLVPDGLTGWFDAFWVGYALLIGGLEAWHLLLPIDWRTCVAFGVLGAIGFAAAVIWQGMPLRSRISIRWLIVALILLVPLAVWISNRALDAQTDFDTALYHLSTIRWTNDFHAVPGIGNVHYRLAFNQSTFLFVALLNVHPYFDQGLHIANSLLIVVLAAQLITGTVRTLRTPDRFSVYTLYEAMWLAVVIYRASRQPFSANVSSPSPDLPVFILMTVVSLLFVRFLYDTDRSEPEQRFTVFSILAVSVVGVTTKLSFIVFGVVTVLLVLIVWLLRHRDRMSQAVRQVLLMGVIASGLIAVPWMARGVVTSGYPFFPSRVGALPVDYRVPAPIAKEAEEWVYSFARNPAGEIDAVFRDWSWIPAWFGRMRKDFNAFLFYIPFFAAPAALSIYVVISLLRWLIRRRQYLNGPADWRLWLPLLPAIGSGLFWFLSAPDPRFAGSAFWIAALWAGVMVISTLWITRRVWQIAVMAVPLLAGAVFIVLGIHANFNLEGSGFPAIPVVPVREYRTESGLIVYIPSVYNLQLWDAPLPSSPYELPLLEQRTANMQDGFRMRAEP